MTILRRVFAEVMTFIKTLRFSSQLVLLQGKTGRPLFAPSWTRAAITCRRRVERAISSWERRRALANARDEHIFERRLDPTHTAHQKPLLA